MKLATNILLSDGFADFSGKVTALHEKKKELTAEFKKLYEEHKSAMAAIDAEADALQNEFDPEKSPKPPTEKYKKK